MRNVLEVLSVGPVVVVESFLGPRPYIFGFLFVVDQNIRQHELYQTVCVRRFEDAVRASEEGEPKWL